MSRVYRISLKYRCGCFIFYIGACSGFTKRKFFKRDTKGFTRCLFVVDKFIKKEQRFKTIENDNSKWHA